MTTLESLMAAFLRDLTLAQNAANHLTARLSLEYRQHSILRFLPTPNALLDEAEVTLRFAFDGLEPDAETGTRSEPDEVRASAPPSRILAADAAAAASPVAIAEIRDRIARLSGDGAGSASAPTLIQSEAGRADFVRALTARLHELIMRRYLERDAPELDGEAAAAVGEAMLSVSAREPETVRRALAPILAAFDPRDAGARAAVVIRAALNARERRAHAETGASKANIYVAAKDLVDFPDYAVQTIRLRARLRNYRWVVVREGDFEEDQLLAEH